MWRWFNMVLGARNVEGAAEMILKVFNFKLAKNLQNITKKYREDIDNGV